jgi:hypothetical protein
MVFAGAQELGSELHHKESEYGALINLWDIQFDGLDER